MKCFVSEVCVCVCVSVCMDIYILGCDVEYISYGVTQSKRVQRILLGHNEEENHTIFENMDGS